MTIRTYSTFAGARRAAQPGQPILRLLDDPAFELFVVLPRMSTQIMALAPDQHGRADGSISFLDLSTGGKAS